MDVGALFMFFGGISNFVDRSIYDNFVHCHALNCSCFIRCFLRRVPEENSRK